MERRRLGRTGHESAVAVLGGAAFARATPEETEQAFTEALMRGVNHLDIAPRYGLAEELVGPFLPTVRARVFVGCKTTRRNPEGVRAQLEESLEKLHTDYFDLYQMHAVTDLEVLEDRAQAADEILRARDEGLVRFRGITGHNDGAPGAHLEALRRWDLDTVMFPVNARMWADGAYRRDAEALLELCAERDIGVMAIKAAARKPWAEGDRFATTWYHPFDEYEDISRAINFTLSVPGVHAICTPATCACSSSRWMPPTRSSPWTSRSVPPPSTRRRRYPRSSRSPSRKGAFVYATLITNHGNIRVRLLDDTAPETVANFVGLASGQKEYTDPVDGAKKTGAYYNGTVFHRVIPNFMIQGGDPTGTGRGGPGYQFKDEVDGGPSFDGAGYLAMANAGPGTNGSQFFITVAPTPHLNRKHTIFGVVEEGQDVADAISKVRTGPGDRPRDDVVLEEVRIEQ